MTEVQKLQAEIDKFNAKRKVDLANLEVESDFPKIKRGFSYRKSPVIKSSDVCSL